MNQKVKTYLPAVIVVLIAAALLIYQATTGKQMPDDLKQKMQDAANNGQKLTIEQMKEMRGKGEGGGWKDWMTQVGNVSIFFGAVSFWWFRFRRKLKSPLPWVKKAAKYLYKVHNFAGWTALVLTAVHAAYFLYTKKLGDRDQLSGIAAGLILLTLAGYGYVIRKFKNKWTRQVHKLMSFAWLIALALHAGGFFGACVGVTIGLWILLEIVERQTIAKKQVA
ncbi:hypothetical protein [Ectobacillus ponti]|uniref:Uncharacterized protein n=1 Tax=Ectobacillus ponti TaxID=2961894 RepID=A0AA41XC35_9BACI|nr:hypothetical protein [Ectobacillus ponti]MCP8969301.1 hypothetical protein [Ectobacillus ponti]